MVAADPRSGGELPALATAVADRLGVVRRITLNADAWTSWPHQLVIIGGRRVRLDWCTGDAHTIRLTSGNASHLVLLAIPPDTPTILALACLARAAGAAHRSGMTPAATATSAAARHGIIRAWPMRTNCGRLICCRHT